MKFIYREHALKRMFERDISQNEIEDTVLNGEIIEKCLMAFSKAWA